MGLCTFLSHWTLIPAPTDALDTCSAAKIRRYSVTAKNTNHDITTLQSWCLELEMDIVFRTTLCETSREWYTVTSRCRSVPELRPDTDESKARLGGRTGRWNVGRKGCGCVSEQIKQSLKESTPPNARYTCRFVFCSSRWVHSVPLPVQFMKRWRRLGLTFFVKPIRFENWNREHWAYA